MRFQNGCNKVAIEHHFVQFWTEIIKHMIPNQVALHSAQLPLLIFQSHAGMQQKLAVLKIFSISHTESTLV